MHTKTPTTHSLSTLDDDEMLLFFVEMFRQSLSLSLIHRNRLSVCLYLNSSCFFCRARIVTSNNVSDEHQLLLSALLLSLNEQHIRWMNEKPTTHSYINININESNEEENNLKFKIDKKKMKDSRAPNAS